MAGSSGFFIKGKYKTIYMVLTPGFLFAAFIALGLWAGFLFLIIQAASKSKEQTKSLEIQTRILIKIAQKNGVTNEEIKECMSSMPLPQ